MAHRSIPTDVSNWRALERNHNYAPRMGDYDAAMTFDEIAVQLGTDRQHVWNWYARGIKKLRRNPEVLRRLLDVANHLASERDKRAPVEVQS